MLKLSLILVAVGILGGCSFTSFEGPGLKIWNASIGTKADIKDFMASSEACDIKIGQYKKDQSEGIKKAAEGAAFGAMKGLRSGL